MKNLDMIETQGGGIRKLFNFQKERFFPMPDYNFNDNKVKVTIIGKVLNDDFAKIMLKSPNLSLNEIITLDKVQKKQKINDEEYSHLKKLKLIEGRKNNAHLSLKLIEQTNNEALKAQYITNRSFNDSYFKEMIIGYLREFGKTKRSALDNLIIPKLSDVLTNEQKKNKVTNLLSSLRMERKIKSPSYGTWEVLNEF